uniref:Uncharacterized protein n=1 Tax=Chromera velia CCMP2878 TaxID=1169474 RepID=A0A0G4I9V5_9ALVE|eukprot:Cvel_12280.t1-p1 / transcript=Cvel_12280.t1 / gene=Cvel_12280 / organism=Chromera_velia_CCMP2878 / gene_product=hypothetical protein / transcript_product=hypothetical protein / location=Cvel_scaffold796:64039-64893(-) / protein_length=79 / sequence_SO=supercontig / SO=protein_coding / is_pseudo=false
MKRQEALDKCANFGSQSDWNDYKDLIKTASPSGKVILVDGQGGVHQSRNAAVCSRASFTPVWKAYLSLPPVRDTFSAIV